MYDYGNARVAAMRSRLLDLAAIRRLSEADSASAFLGLLERSADWRPIVRETSALGVDPAASVEGSIERHRAARLGALPRFYPEPARRLVAALVVPLDHERLVAIVRRRWAGESPERIGSTIVAGALLDALALGEIARTSGFSGLLREVVVRGLLRRTDAPLIAARAGAPDRRLLEEFLLAGLDRARTDLATGRGDDAARVRQMLARERADRRTAARELREAGPSAAALVERTLVLDRLDELAAVGRRDPLGIGAVAGYVAAVEAEAIRVRAALARVISGWSPELAGAWLGSGRTP